MLEFNNISDREKMMNYYRTSDMINLINFFPSLSPIKDLTIVESIEEYKKLKSYLETFSQNRIDILKGRNPNINIENSGGTSHLYEILKRIKEIDPYGVLVLFNLTTEVSERYQRYAGISVGVDLGHDIYIDAVSKGFDGREVSKSICTHERYHIPWFDLRKVNASTLKEYQTYKISDTDYKKTREERIKFLTSVGLDPNEFTKYIPEHYEEIPDFIWLSVIRNLLKELESKEDELAYYGFDNFAISGHTEGKEFSPWQMFDKTRYTRVRKREI